MLDLRHVFGVIAAGALAAACARSPSAPTPAPPAVYAPPPPDPAVSCSLTAFPAKDGLPSGTAYSGGLTAGTLTVGANGGRIHFSVLTDPFRGCPWTAESDDAWVSWDSPHLHQGMLGDGDLYFTVPASGGGTRRAELSLGGRFRLTIVQ
jgi:hypothetical protein